jgi:phosphoserine phosphatase
MPPALPTGPSVHAIDRALFEQVLSCARRLASSSDLHEVLSLIIDTLRDFLHADRVSVFQYDAKTHELFATQAHGLPRSLRLPADLGIVGEAARTRTIINIPDAYADPRFNPAVDKSTGYRTQCLLTIPLVDFEGQLAGVAQLLNKSRDHGGTFTDEDERIAMHLADQAAVALKRAALLESRRIKEKLEADIDVARKIQQASMPSALPELRGYDLAGHFQPADETAGDAYDVVDLRAVAEANGSRRADALLFMADATGHGIGPALSVAQVLAMIRIATRLGADVDSIARHVNRQLCRDLPMGRFVTAFIGRLNLDTHELVYASAGQAPLVFVSARGEGEERNANAMPFGIDDEFHFDAVPPFTFRPGDAFVLLSDGYYEASNPRGDMFGVDRVIASVRASLHKPADDILADLRRELLSFCEGKPADDDQTALIVKRTA